MADRQIHSLKPLPMANYSSAIARAVEWLGDRYLLAKPINAVPEQSMKSGRHGDVGARARRAEQTGHAFGAAHAGRGERGEVGAPIPRHFHLSHAVAGGGSSDSGAAGIAGAAKGIHAERDQQRGGLGR
jgi:hypothetical protein